MSAIMLASPSRFFCTTAQSANPQGAQEQVDSLSTKKPMTFGRFMLYAVGVSSASYFVYNLYQAGGNLHKTEILIGRQLAKLPFYYPPGPHISERNASLPSTPELPATLVDQLSAWFIQQDSVSKDGLTRADILDLFGDKLGLVDNDRPDSAFQDESLRKVLTQTVDDFIEKGKGRLTEYKRQSGVSIQETLEFLNELVRIHKEHAPDSKSLLDGIASILHEELGRIVDVPVPATLSQSLPDVEDVNEKDLLEMELQQLQRAREDIVKSRSESALSEAERERVLSIEYQIQQVGKLIEAC